MKKMLMFITMGIFLIMSAGSAFADTLGCGARAIALGGAYVAVADDGSAPYWNPAGINQIHVLTFTPSLGNEGSWNYSSAILDTNNFLPQFKQTSMELNAQGYVGVSSRNFAINVLYDITGNYGAVTQNIAKAQGLGIGYGVLTLAAKPNEAFMLGLNVKTVYGKVVISNMNMDTVNPTNSNATMSTANGQGTAFDVGMIYTVNDQLNLGLVGRNLITNFNWSSGTLTTYHYNPLTNTFSSYGDGTAYSPTISLTRSNTVGASYRPFGSTLLAADVEMIDGNGLQEAETRLHLGFEQTAFSDRIKVRLGGFTIKNQSPALTGGIGFELGPVMLDIAAVQENGNWGAYCTAGFHF